MQINLIELETAKKFKEKIPEALENKQCEKGDFQNLLEKEINNRKSDKCPSPVNNN